MLRDLNPSWSLLFVVLSQDEPGADVVWPGSACQKVSVVVRLTHKVSNARGLIDLRKARVTGVLACVQPRRRARRRRPRARLGGGPALSACPWTLFHGGTCMGAGKEVSVVMEYTRKVGGAPGPESVPGSGPERTLAFGAVFLPRADAKDAADKRAPVQDNVRLLQSPGIPDLVYSLGNNAHAD